MGADLYLMAEQTEKKRAKYRQLFEQTVKERNTCQKDTPEEKAMQTKVDKYWQSLYGEEAGYFRDSYNDSNLLWQFSLDYWQWLNKLLDKNGELTPQKASLILKALQQNKGIFAGKLSKMEKPRKDYFLDKYRQFKSFLQTAIHLNCKIDCSI